MKHGLDSCLHKVQAKIVILRLTNGMCFEAQSDAILLEKLLAN